MSFIDACTTSLKKWRKLMTNPDLTFEFQTYTLKFLAYNYLIVLLIANQDVQWNYAFKGELSTFKQTFIISGVLWYVGTEIKDRFGYELMEPMILSKFGFCFRLITIIMNTLSLVTFLDATHKTRIFLMPCILWNFYTVAAVAENIIEIMWSMYILEVPLPTFANTVLVGFFMLAFQSKLTLQMIRFYEYLNYIPIDTEPNTSNASKNK